MSSEEGSSSDDESYGPALPPHMLLAKKPEELVVDEEQAKEDDSRGRSAAVIGPSLPPGFKPSTSMTQPDEQLDDEQVDPSPTRRVVTTTTTTIKSKSEADRYELGSYKEEEGNSDEDDDADDDEDIVGPFPPDHPKAQQQTYSHHFPSKTDSSKPKREEWMLIPPKNKPISGLAARKFLPRSLETRKHDDDEDNDEDNEKQDLKERFQSQLIEKRDELMSNLISESGSGSSDRSESLLQIHRKRKHEEEKKKTGADASKKERRPFDRDQDLKVSGMNEDDKQRFIKRATSELQGRFSHGKKAGKFL